MPLSLTPNPSASPPCPSPKERGVKCQINKRPDTISVGRPASTAVRPYTTFSPYHPQSILLPSPLGEGLGVRLRVFLSLKDVVYLFYNIHGINA